MLYGDKFSIWLSGKDMGILTTHGLWKAIWGTLWKPSKSTRNFCHRCQKPEEGVVLGIDILTSIYVTLIMFNLCIYSIIQS